MNCFNDARRISNVIIIEFLNSSCLSRLIQKQADQFFCERRESGLRPFRGSALATSTLGWLGYKRGEPLRVLDYTTVNILQAGPVELQACPANQAASLLLFRRQGHIHHLAQLPLLAVGSHHHCPQAGIGQPGLPRARRAACAVPFHSARWVPGPPR